MAPCKTGIGHLLNTKLNENHDMSELLYGKSSGQQSDQVICNPCHTKHCIVDISSKSRGTIKDAINSKLLQYHKEKLIVSHTHKLLTFTKLNTVSCVVFELHSGRLVR